MNLALAGLYSGWLAVSFAALDQLRRAARRRGD